MQPEGHESEARTQLADFFSIMLEGCASMLKCLINVSHAQRLLIYFAGLVLMCSEIYAFRYVVCRSTRPLGSS